MDFTLGPAQQAVADVVTSVLDRENSWDALVAGGVTAHSTRLPSMPFCTLPDSNPNGPSLARTG